jgi:hypothetical protein
MDALSAQGNLSEGRPAPHAYNLDGEANPVSMATLSSLRRWRTQVAGQISPVNFDSVAGGVHSREHTRVNSGERQGPEQCIVST